MASLDPIPAQSPSTQSEIPRKRIDCITTTLEEQIVAINPALSPNSRQSEVKRLRRNDSTRRSAQRKRDGLRADAQIGDVVGGSGDPIVVLSNPSDTLDETPKTPIDLDIDTRSDREGRRAPRSSRLPRACAPNNHDWLPHALLNISNRRRNRDIAPFSIPEISIPSPVRSLHDHPEGLEDLLRQPREIQHAWWSAFRRWNYADTEDSWALLRAAWAEVVPNSSNEEWNALRNGEQPDPEAPNSGTPLAELYSKVPVPDGDLSWLQNTLWCPRRVGRLNRPKHLKWETEDSLQTELDPFTAPVFMLQPILRPADPDSGINNDAVIWNGVSGHTFRIPTDPPGYFSENAPMNETGPSSFSLEIRRVRRLNWRSPIYEELETDFARQIVRPVSGKEFKRIRDENKNKILSIRLERIMVPEAANQWLTPGEMQRRRNRSQAISDGVDAEESEWAEYLEEHEADREGYDYFVFNLDTERRVVNVNGSVINFGEVAGPLPAFAVILVPGGQICFWWGVDGREYAPSKEALAATRVRPPLRRIAQQTPIRQMNRPYEMRADDASNGDNDEPPRPVFMSERVDERGKKRPYQARVDDDDVLPPAEKRVDKASRALTPEPPMLPNTDLRLRGGGFPIDLNNLNDSWQRYMASIRGWLTRTETQPFGRNQAIPVQTAQTFPSSRRATSAQPPPRRAALIQPSTRRATLDRPSGQPALVPTALTTTQRGSGQIAAIELTRSTRTISRPTIPKATASAKVETFARQNALTGLAASVQTIPLEKTSGQDLQSTIQSARVPQNTPLRDGQMPRILRRVPAVCTRQAIADIGEQVRNVAANSNGSIATGAAPANNLKRKRSSIEELREEVKRRKLWLPARFSDTTSAAALQAALDANDRRGRAVGSTIMQPPSMNLSSARTTALSGAQLDVTQSLGVGKMSTVAPGSFFGTKGPRQAIELSRVPPPVVNSLPAALRLPAVATPAEEQRRRKDMDRPALKRECIERKVFGEKWSSAWDLQGSGNSQYKTAILMRIALKNDDMKMRAPRSTAARHVPAQRTPRQPARISSRTTTDKSRILKPNEYDKANYEALLESCSLRMCLPFPEGGAVLLEDLKLALRDQDERDKRAAPTSLSNPFQAVQVLQRLERQHLKWEEESRTQPTHSWREGRVILSKPDPESGSKNPKPVLFL